MIARSSDYIVLVGRTLLPHVYRSRRGGMSKSIRRREAWRRWDGCYITRGRVSVRVRSLGVRRRRTSRRCAVVSFVPQ